MFYRLVGGADGWEAGSCASAEELCGGKRRRSSSGVVCEGTRRSCMCCSSRSLRRPVGYWSLAPPGTCFQTVTSYSLWATSLCNITWDAGTAVSYSLPPVTHIQCVLRIMWCCAHRDRTRTHLSELCSSNFKSGQFMVLPRSSCLSFDNSPSGCPSHILESNHSGTLIGYAKHKNSPSLYFFT